MADHASPALSRPVSTSVAPSVVVALGALIAVAAFATDVSLPAVPAIADDLGAPIGQVQWIISLYLLGFGLGQIPVGLAGDRYGRRPVIFVGMMLYVICALVCSLTDQLGLILVARFVQGVGGAVGPVLARAIARDLLGGREGARLQSVLLGILTLAPLLAPLFGSGLIALFGWRATFLSLVVLGSIVAALCQTQLPETGHVSRAQSAWQDLADGMRAYFCQKQCWSLAVIVVLVSSGYFTMLTQSSAIADDVFGIGPTYFGWLFAAVALSFLIGTLLSRAALRWLSVPQLISVGMSVLVLFCCCMALVSVFHFGALMFWGSISIYILAMGILGPSVMAAILEPLPKMSGRVAAITGTLQMTIGATVGAAAALAYDGSVATMALLMIVFAALAVVWWGGFARHVVRID